jgi:hypothetical protein
MHKIDINLYILKIYITMMNQLSTQYPQFFKYFINDIIIANNIPYNEIIYEDYVKYCENCLDWFQDEVILISFINKLFDTDPMKYHDIIFELYNLLMRNLINIKEFFNKNYPSNTNDGGFKYGVEYINFLLNNDNITKILPTQKDGFMYIGYYNDYYSICIKHNNKYCKLSTLLTDMFDDEIVNVILLYIRNNINYYLINTNETLPEIKRKNKRLRTDDDATNDKKTRY